MKYDELKKLDELRLSGALTQEEFEREKTKLLGDAVDDSSEHRRGWPVLGDE
ncbi:MAG: SHOCT domain-containing protein [Uliginosibacterium sp.]|nr:SHOCT domain-containing protein [Uliginosibacterium sp.]